MGLALQRVRQGLKDALYPPTCMMCDARVQEDGGLCPTCWAATPFITGAACQMCGTPLPGDDDGPSRCDDCLTLARPWNEGRAALVYAGGGRRLVLALKHGDRTELVKGAAAWMHRRSHDLLTARTRLVPVPLHRWRLLKRRYNQSALLAAELAQRCGGTFAPADLQRGRSTPSQDHRSVADRFANIAGAISAAPDLDLSGEQVVLVDDVMTSGATLAACTDALHGAGAERVSVLVLARVAKDL
ncbi:MAG: ComF family protein [Pseudomonadota bacterium]